MKYLNKYNVLIKTDDIAQFREVLTDARLSGDGLRIRDAPARSGRIGNHNLH